MIKYEIVKPDHVFRIPKDIAICPYCDAEIFAQFDEWAQVDDGSWVGTGVHFDCANMPDDSDQAFSVYVREHTYMPYVYRLPVCTKIERWILGKYRFDMNRNPEGE